MVAKYILTETIFIIIPIDKLAAKNPPINLKQNS